MSKPTVRCHCGHQVLGKEVLRTDLVERSRGRDCVYVRFRCRRCKRLGEAFIAESRWDWSILEPDHTEMGDDERDRFLDQAPISEGEVLSFHDALTICDNVSDLAALTDTPPDKPEREGKIEGKFEGKPEAKQDKPNDKRRRPDFPAAGSSDPRRGDDGRSDDASPSA